jgi:hypothetical protein
MYHPGPFNIYMARAINNVSLLDGSGEVWFKVFEKGPISINSTKITFNETLQRISFKLPEKLPDGEYLVRVEHIGLHIAYKLGIVQFFISCAQIRVRGGVEVDGE